MLLLTSVNQRFTLSGMRVSIGFDGSTSPLDSLSIGLLAEEAGIDSIWNAEHLGLHDGVVPSALHLSQTQSIEVGIAGFNADSRNPGLLAMEVSGLCKVAPGRVALQVGSGSAELAQTIGVNRTVGTLEVVERFLSTLRSLLSGEQVTETTDAYQLDGFQLRPRVRAPMPVIQLMAMGPRMLELASRCADGVSLSAGIPTSLVVSSVELVNGHLSTLGRDRNAFRVSAFCTVGYDPLDEEAAYLRAARNLAYMPVGYLQKLAPEFALPDQETLTATLLGDGPEAAGGLFDEQTIRAMAMVVTNETLESGLAAYEMLGIDELTLMLMGSPQRSRQLVRELGKAKQSFQLQQPQRKEQFYG